MPIYIKPREALCNERANNDAEFYYSHYFDYIKEQQLEEGSMEIRQQTIRLKKWIDKYKEFAKKFHMKNFIRADDLYVNSNNAELFPINTEIPRAPYLEVLEEIPEEI